MNEMPGTERSGRRTRLAVIGGIAIGLASLLPAGAAFAAEDDGPASADSMVIAVVVPDRTVPSPGASASATDAAADATAETPLARTGVDASTLWALGIGGLAAVGVGTVTIARRRRIP